MGYCWPVLPMGVADPPGVGCNPDSSRKSEAAAPGFVPLKRPLATVGFWKLNAAAVSVPKVHQPTSVRWLMSQGSWNARVAKSKWAKVTTYGKETKGKIDLQDHGTTVEFKNIKILVLK